MFINIQEPEKGVLIVSDGPQLKGITYLSDTQVVKRIRSGEVKEATGLDFSVYGADGSVIAPVPFEHMTAAEKKVYESQVVQFGQNAGKTLLQVREEKEKVAAEERAAD